MTQTTSFLAGIRVLEFADERGEYAGKLLAGLGADVVKIEPPEGEITRTYGPFVDDLPHPDRSLHFWHYNLGKRGVVLDLDTSEGRDTARRLARSADVIIDGRRASYLDERGLGFDDLSVINPGLIYLRITPFGDDGPWSRFEGSDLIHLALGGVMMNCGYDPHPDGHYDTPPIAPQMWQAYHIAGEMAVMSVLGALTARLRDGRGQRLDVNIHQAVSANTETDMPDWVYLRQEHRRLTGRHSMTGITAPALSITKDGRYVMPYRTYLRSFAMSWDSDLAVLKKYGMQADLEDPKYRDPDLRASSSTSLYVNAVTDALISRLLFADDIWKDAQAEGLPWAPIRKPEENVVDPHWRARGTFVEVEHPELDRSFTYVGPRWLCREVPWTIGPRAPLLGEHTAELSESVPRSGGPAAAEALSGDVSDHRGSAGALSGVRVVDLSWMLASAGAGRFLAALGAEVIKVEHDTRWDSMRFGAGMAPAGGRSERETATKAIPTPTPGGPNRSGNFAELNSGKLGIALNLKSPEGRAVLEDLIRDADMIVEGFSPGTMERMGLGYARLRELNPRIVYVQQSGFGQAGTYGSARAFGPTAQGFSGITEMSGLPEPYPPAGIGYSYLDWFGAYNMANAMLAALYRQRSTGQGCYIDTSQAETGLALTGTAVLDHSVNGRAWSRYGNASPYKTAAPHGAYPTAGDDRWLAIAAFTDDQWEALATALEHPEWLADPRFSTLELRVLNTADLDVLLASATRGHDGYELMQMLQSVHVPAGVCQTAQDRYETDPQLSHLAWMEDLPQADIGTWPVKKVPFRMSHTPVRTGGVYGRSGPSYGQDTDFVLASVLERTPEEIAVLRAAGALESEKYHR